MGRAGLWGLADLTSPFAVLGSLRSATQSSVYFVAPPLTTAWNRFRARLIFSHVSSVSFKARTACRASPSWRRSLVDEIWKRESECWLIQRATQGGNTRFERTGILSGSGLGILTSVGVRLVGQRTSHESREQSKEKSVSEERRADGLRHFVSPPTSSTMAEPPRKRPRLSPPPAPPIPTPPGEPSRTISASTTTTSAAAPAAPAAPAATLVETLKSDQARTLASHQVHEPSHYSHRVTPFQQPLHLTSFSYSPTRQLLLDSHNRDDSLSYYREPRLGSDLNVGFDRAVWRDGTVDEGLDALLDT